MGILDASEVPPTYSAQGVVEGWMAGGDAAIRRAAEGAEDSYPQGYKDMDQFGLTELDTLVGIAASGRTPYVLGALQHAKDKGGLTIGLTFNPNTTLASAVDVTIAPLCGPEVVTGSTRMKAGTATKLVLNMLSTAAMVKLGKTLGNLMVDVRASNEKLRVRSVRIIQLALTEHGAGRFHVAGDAAVSYAVDQTEKLQQLMQSCHGHVKLSILIGLTGLDVAAAETLLAKHHGVLRRALDEHIGIARLDMPEKRPCLPLDKTYVVAVDCGGTKMEATVLVQSTGYVIGTARIASTNFATTPVNLFLAQLENVVTLALGGASWPRFEKVWVGSAGCGMDNLRTVLHNHLSGSLFQHTDAANIKVSSDALLLSSCLANAGVDQGVILVAGTGSVVMRCNHQGDELARVGGLGYLVGDEGSGWALGARAIKYTGAVVDGQRASPSTLSNMVLKTLACQPDRQALQTAIYQANDTDMDRKTRICNLARVVVEAALDHQCPVAQDMLASEASDFASTAAVLVQEGDTVVLGGGLLSSVPAYADLVCQELTKRGKMNISFVKVTNVSKEAALTLL
ncbi:hypothetical protein DM01DRAFT_1406992 [Hesseltinella vesiculosa]|uniref:N-acetyl-D-glucosamine kinase n=1 Tax=Hesseltinella vesiculosa TaxID=101127 RepID=A0A1X2GK05_9FUNG|nr:hypothetical protein DM01DRAFT_1406992 [Hesseltinella vesiculosa]